MPGKSSNRAQYMRDWRAKRKPKGTSGKRRTAPKVETSPFGDTSPDVKSEKDIQPETGSSRGVGFEGAAEQMFGGSSGEGGESPSPAPSKQKDQQPEFVINLADVLEKVLNPIIRNVDADFALTEIEVQAIGQPLDMVIEKHFPELKKSTPEVMLIIGVGMYAMRIFPLIKQRRQAAAVKMKQESIRVSDPAPETNFTDRPPQGGVDSPFGGA